jgi:hypothetical protein
MTCARFEAVRCAIMIVVVTSAPLVQAHSGPPFPIVSNRIVGPYEVSVWTDPDATDDGSAAGQFWVVLKPATKGASLPRDTQASVSIVPLDRPGEMRAGRAAPIGGDGARQFIALPISREGRYRVTVALAGPLGVAAVDADVDATYDLRPPPFLLGVYVVPFVLVGFLWIKLLLRRKSLPR